MLLTIFLPPLFWSFLCLHVCMFACACPPPPRQFATGPPIRGDPFSQSQAHIPLKPLPPALGCNRNRLDINTTTVGGRGGTGGLCIPVVIAPSRRARRGGGVREMDIRDPPWAQANFPPPQFRAPSIHFMFFRRKNCLMWVVGWVRRRSRGPVTLSRGLLWSGPEPDNWQKSWWFIVKSPGPRLVNRLRIAGPSSNKLPSGQQPLISHQLPLRQSPLVIVLAARRVCFSQKGSGPDDHSRPQSAADTCTRNCVCRDLCTGGRMCKDICMCVGMACLPLFRVSRDATSVRMQIFHRRRRVRLQEESLLHPPCEVVCDAGQ